MKMHFRCPTVLNINKTPQIYVRKWLEFDTIICYTFVKESSLKEVMAMINRDSALYEAFKSKDIRFDGKFFVGVTSTGIYCRPVCRARIPKEENCVFFHTAVEAEKSGFRPCLICRPELAPGLSSSDEKSVLAKRAVRYIEEHCGDSKSLEELAARLGYTDRHLRRVFAEEYHVSPLEYMQTCRLLLAKNLLTDSVLSILDVAMASGFGSLRRFNDLFQKQYHLSPSDFRKQAKAGKQKGDTITIGLGYQPPYEWNRLLHFLSLRAIPGVETVENGCYSRTVRIRGKDEKERFGWFSVSNCPERYVLSVTLSDSLLPVLPQILGRIRNLFDLYCEPLSVSERLMGQGAIAPGDFVCGLRVPGCFDPFEICVIAILEQQITVKAAATLAGEMAAAFGKHVKTNIPGLCFTFSTVADMLGLQGEMESHLEPLGMIAAMARAIQSLATAINIGDLDFELCCSPESTIKKLMEIPGVSSQTATYIAMRTLGYTDAFTETDLVIRKALGNQTPKEMRDLSEQWRPWRSYATMALWDSYNTEEKK